MNNEEAFILASLKEFVKLWGSGRDASFKLECYNGQAWFRLDSKLGAPGSPHFEPHVPQNHFPHKKQPPQRRRKGPSRREKDYARAAAHRLRVTADPEDLPAPPPASPPAATAGSGSPPSPLPAASAGRSPSPPPAASAGISLTSPGTASFPAATAGSSPTPAPLPAASAGTSPTPPPAATAGTSPTPLSPSGLCVKDVFCPDVEFERRKAERAHERQKDLELRASERKKDLEERESDRKKDMEAFTKLCQNLFKPP